MNDQLDAILKSLGIVSLNARQLFIEAAEVKEWKKGKDIFVAGKTNSSEYILISGMAHRYNVSEDGAMVTTGFYGPAAVVTPHFARVHKGKCIFSLQTLTDVVLAEIRVSELDSLRYQHKEWTAFGMQVVEAELLRTFYNEVVFRSYSARERLLAMRAQFPQLENEVPHQVIASYLGITPVSLSRLRNALAKP